METAACQAGTPKGMRIIMATGEVKGMNESQVESEPVGSLIMAGIMIITNISGMVTGRENC